VSWPTLIMMAGLLIGGRALVGVLLDVSKSFDTVIGADWLRVIIAFVLAQLALATGLAMAVPRLRKLATAHVLPRVRQIWANLRQVAVSPRKLILLGSGSFARQLLVAMTLSVSLRAFGEHPWLPVLIVIITLAGIIGRRLTLARRDGRGGSGHDPRPDRGRRPGVRRHRRRIHPAPVHLVPAAHLGLGRPGLDAEERVPLTPGGTLPEDRKRAARMTRPLAEPVHQAERPCMSVPASPCALHAAPSVDQRYTSAERTRHARYA
jgi:hypothetical protein